MASVIAELIDSTNDATTATGPSSSHAREGRVRRTKAERGAYYCAECQGHGDHPTDRHGLVSS